MTELVAVSASPGWSGKSIAGARFGAFEPQAILSVAPFAGAGAEVSQALQQATGLPLPEVGECLGTDAAGVIWFGRGQAMFIGPDPGRFTQAAALTDQSDAWTVLRLEGRRARDVLARLVPLDLRPSAFAQGQSARSELGHMMLSLSCTGADVFLLMVMRSMTKTAIHEIEAAMENIAARDAL